MNLYYKKQRWKIFLFISALLIIAASLVYTNFLVKKIANEEREKARLWAEAIQKKASLVKYTSLLFEKLATEEREKMEWWAQATKMLLTSDNNNDQNFFLNILNSNDNIPLILTDENYNIKSWRNIDSVHSNSFSELTEAEKNYLNKLLEKIKSEKKPIEIPYFKDLKDLLFFDDSKILSDLKLTMDDIISSFISEIVINSATVPVIMTDSTQNHIISFGNIDSSILNNPKNKSQLIESMLEQDDPIEIDLGGSDKRYIFYRDSFLLTQLKYYPFIQFGVIGLFLLIAYFLFSTSRRAEQNQVWVGMSKETAHQLGTPLSSLMAWLEVLKLRENTNDITPEMEKDVIRLNTITERFSKIGSAPDLNNENIYDVLNNSIAYLKPRVSQKVIFEMHNDLLIDTKAPINIPLFEWVIENLIKNAVDAMSGEGKIKIEVSVMHKKLMIDLSDTGKGIEKSDFKNVFQPGYTTKKRGWGLGLSLVKRIIEDYHKGKIFVKTSEIGKGTTFRIVLNT